MGVYMLQFIKMFFSKILYNNDYELLNNRFKKSQDYFIMQGVFNSAATIVVSGVFLAGYFVYLGASDQMIGFLNLLPNICGITLLFSSAFLELFKKRRSLIMAFTAVTYLLILLILFVPFLIPKAYQSFAALALLCIAYILQALKNTAVNCWLINVVPENIRGRYYSIRQIFLLIVSIALPVFAGMIMDSIGSKYIGFVILCCMGFIFMIIENYSIYHIEEPYDKSETKNKFKLIDSLKLPMKNKQYLKYILFIDLIYIILYISCTFTSVYEIRYLKLSYTLMTSIGVWMAILQIIFYKIWGTLSDKYGHDFVLMASVWFFSGELSMWALMPKTMAAQFMMCASVFSAIANSGFMLSTFNKRFEMVPKEGRALYDGFFNAGLGLALLLSPILGGVLKDAIASSSVFRNIEFGQFRILYAMSASGIFILQLIKLFLNKKKKINLNKNGRVNA